MENEELVFRQKKNIFRKCTRKGYPLRVLYFKKGGIFMKKTAALFLSLLLLTFLPGCSKKPAEEEMFGSINDVDIKSRTQEVQEENNYFSPIEETLGYAYQTVTMKRAAASFQVPKSWSVRIENARHAVLQAPPEDPKLPNVTVHILFDFRTYHEYRRTPGMYSEIFGDELCSLDYKIGGTYYHQAYSLSPSSERTDRRFSGNDAMISIVTMEDVLAEKGKTGFTPDERITATYYFVNWQDQPMVLGCLSEETYAAVLQEELSYIVSTLTYEKPSLEKVKTVTIQNVFLSLPDDFMPFTVENIFLCPYQEKSQSASGMGVGVFHVKEKIREQNQMAQYQERLGKFFIPVQNVNAYSVVPKEEVQVGNRKGKAYSITGTVMLSSASGGGYYRSGSSCYLDTYAVDDEQGGTYLLVIFYLDDQTMLSARLSGIVLSSIQFR